MPRGYVKTLIEIMGTETWDVHTLRLEFNKREKWGLSTRALSQKLAGNKQFEVVGKTSITTGFRKAPKGGYRLYAVKPQYLEVEE